MLTPSPDDLVSYCVTEAGNLHSYSGEDRLKNVDALQRDGGFLLFTSEFPPYVTADERKAFFDGVRAGRDAALELVRAALGVERP